MKLILTLLSLATFTSCTTIETNSHQNVRTTAYTHNESDHIRYGRKTAIGTTLESSSTTNSAASDWSVYPLGTKFKIEGSSKVYTIDDYGSALVGTHTIDIYCPSHKTMRKWGTRHVDIQIIQMGSYSESLELLRQRMRWRHCRQMAYNIKNNHNDKLTRS